MSEHDNSIMKFNKYPQFCFCNPVCYDSLVSEVGIDRWKEVCRLVCGVYDEAFHWANVKQILIFPNIIIARFNGPFRQISSDNNNSWKYWPRPLRFCTGDTETSLAKLTPVKKQWSFWSHKKRSIRTLSGIIYSWLTLTDDTTIILCQSAAQKNICCRIKSFCLYMLKC